MLFIYNLGITLESSVSLKDGTKAQYLRMLVHGESLRQFDVLSSDLEGVTPVTLEYIILGLGAYFFPINALYK